MLRLPPLSALFVLAAAQQRPAIPAAPAPVTDISPFRRLELPAAGTTRTGSGAPGHDYWQQRADYVIRASLGIEQVDSVTAGTVNGRASANTYLRNAGPMVMPVQLLVTFEDGSTERVRLPVEIWFGGNS